MGHPSSILFVYGTLKRGDVRAPLLHGQRFIGEVSTLAQYRLFNTGDYPAMVDATPLGMTGRSIEGELWAVDGACLNRLDLEEGVDEGLYERRMIELADGHRAWTYLYLHPVDGMVDCGVRWDIGK